MDKPSSVSRKFLDSNFPSNFNQISLETNFVEAAKLASLFAIPIWLAVVFSQNE
jgi:hypothetical protein